MRSLAAVLGIEEATLRGSVGLPPEAPVEAPDEVGGEGLAAFAAEGSPDVELSGPSPAAAQRKTDEEARAADAMAGVERDEPVEQVSDPAPPVDEAKSDGSLADGAVGGHPAEPLEEPETVAAPENDTAPEPAGPEVVADGDVEPVENGSDGDGLPVAPAGGARFPAPQPVASAAAAATSRTTLIPVNEPPVQPVAHSYLNDPDQMITYWIRAAMTVAFSMFLLVVLFWALGRLGDSIGEVWDLFKAAA